MLSRISLISKQAKKHTRIALLKSLNSTSTTSNVLSFAFNPYSQNLYLKNGAGLRQMSTDDSKKGQNEEEDYNLNDEALSKQNQRPAQDSQDRQRQRFGERDRERPNREARKGGMFKRDDQEKSGSSMFRSRGRDEMSSYDRDQSSHNWTRVSEQEESEMEEGIEEVPEETTMPFEEYKETRQYKLQQELFSLIKEKIGTQDRGKAKLFINKLQELAETNEIKIDQFTLIKIEGLLKNKQEIDDKELYEEMNLLEDLDQTVKIAPSIYENLQPSYVPLRLDQDTQKYPPVQNQEEYEMRVQQQMIDIIDNQNLQLEKIGFDHLNEMIELSNFPAEKEELDQALEDQRREIQMQNLDPVKDKFSVLKKVTDEVTTFQDTYNEYKELLDIKERQKLVLKEPSIEEIEKIEQPEDVEITQEIESDIESLGQDIIANNANDLQTQFTLTKSMIELNEQLKDRLYQNFKVARQSLAECLKKRQNLLSRLEISAKDHSSDAMPDKLFNFIKFNKDTHNASIQKKKQLQEQFQQRQFDLKSKVSENYEKELSFLVSMFKNTPDTSAARKKVLPLMHTVLEAMTKNEIEQTQGIKGRLFEYAVIAKNQDLANKTLKEINGAEQLERISFVDYDLLTKFFSQSLRADNFNGLGHLITYLDNYGLDISFWPMRKFNSAVNYYTNASFNLSNLLIFTRYYAYYNTCRLNRSLKNLAQEEDGYRKEIEELTQAEKLRVSKEVFGGQDSNVVDMRSLFGTLVNKLGSHEALDPVTREDGLWKLIDYYTKRGISELAHNSQTLNNTLDERDIALYFKNHLNNSKTFEKLTSVILRLNNQGAQSSLFQNLMIQNLREHQAKEKSLPFSFEASRIRKAYLGIKNAKKVQGDAVNFNEKTLEYFLFLFKSQQMWPEIIDLCENYQHLAGIEGGQSEIKNYYLSDALLQIPSKQHYNEILQEAVFNNKEVDNAGYITAMTKAYFKDGSASHAIQYFSDSIQKLRDLKTKREDLLVSLFDAAYGEEAPKDMTYEQFRQRYLNVLQFSQQCVQESFVVNQLSRVIKDKSYEEIETLFQLYIVEKEETGILNSLPQYSLSNGQFGLMRQVNPDELKGVDKKTKERLQMIRERKRALKSKISENDVKALNQIMEVMKDKKIAVFDNVSFQSADEIQKMFNIMNKDQVKDILNRTAPLFQVVNQIVHDEATPMLNSFADKNKQQVDDTLKRAADSMFQVRDIPQRGVEKAIDRVYDNPNAASPMMEDQVDYLNQYLLDGAIVEDTDPLIIQEKIFNRNLNDMKEDLLHAINSRKAKVLKIAVEMFNKVQDQTLKTVKLSDVENIKNVSNEEINQTLQKYEMLLNDERSPIFSALQTMGKNYVDEDADFDDFFDTPYDYGTVRFDIEAVRKENDHLTNLNDQLYKSQQQLRNVQTTLIQHLKDLNSNKQVNDLATSRVSDARDEELKAQLEKRMKQLYQEYQTTKNNNAPSKFDFDIPRQDKLAIMRDVFTMEYQDNFTNNLFPAFYSQDLIIFGLENNIPEAIRLGEHMMSENGQQLSSELQMAVKEYMLNNSAQYQRAIKTTGPINNASLYYASKRKHEQPTIICWDDPYWQDLMRKSYKRTEQWRVPSHFAWNHKPHGILDELFDFKKITETQNQIQQSSRFM